MTVIKHFREGPFDESRSILLRIESKRGRGWGNGEDRFKITVDNIQEDPGLENCSVVRYTKCFYNLQKNLKERHLIHCLPNKMLMKLFGPQRKLFIFSKFLTKIFLSTDLRTSQVNDVLFLFFWWLSRSRSRSKSKAQSATQQDNFPSQEIPGIVGDCQWWSGMVRNSQGSSGKKIVLGNTLEDELDPEVEFVKSRPRPDFCNPR